MLVLSCLPLPTARASPKVLWETFTLAIYRFLHPQRNMHNLKVMGIPSQHITRGLADSFGHRQLNTSVQVNDVSETLAEKSH